MVRFNFKPEFDIKALYKNMGNTIFKERIINKGLDKNTAWTVLQVDDREHMT